MLAQTAIFLHLTKFCLSLTISASEPNFEAPLLDLDNTLTSFTITKDDLNLTFSSSDPFYNENDGFGVNSGQNLANRIDSTETVTVTFSKPVYLTKIQLGAFAEGEAVIFLIGSKIFYGYGTSSSDDLAIVTSLNFVPVALVNRTLLIKPYFGSEFSLLSLFLTNSTTEATSTAGTTTSTTSSLWTTIGGVETTIGTETSGAETSGSETSGAWTQSPTSSSGETQLILIGVGVAAVVITLGVIITIILVRRRKRQETTVLHGVRINKFEDGDIQIGNQIGQGNFGAVYRGKWKGSDVALKKMMDGSADIDGEIQILSQLNHMNIVRLFGSFGGYIVTEYVSNGSLDEYLKQSKTLGAADLIEISLQICAGMIYLQQHSVIHRDLAARNVLVDEKSTCKISDFGLSRRSTTGEYISNTAIFPVRWSAPEVLTDSIFSHESDIWSYGVTLWEIWSYGETPYRNLSNTAVMRQVISGMTLEMPARCPHEIYRMMLEMWAQNPADRKTFISHFDKLTEIRGLGKEPLSDSQPIYIESHSSLDDQTLNNASLSHSFGDYNN